MASGAAIDFYTKLQQADDSQLTPLQRQLRAANPELFTPGRTYNILTDGKVVAKMYEEFRIREAHEKGSSAVLTAADESTVEGLPGILGLPGQALRGLNFLGDTLKRIYGSAPGALGITASQEDAQNGLFGG
jgi:hypothetical protein